MDRRVKYTKLVLRQSLLALLVERPVGQITVTALCAHADVNRNTFYAHYGNPTDVLAEIERDLLAEVQQSLESLLEVEHVTGMLTEILRSLDNNRALCRILFSKTGDADFLSRILAIAHDRSVDAWRTAKPALHPDQMEMLYAFFSQGSAAVIRQWIVQDSEHSEKRASPEQLASFLQQLITRGFQSFS